MDDQVGAVDKEESAVSGESVGQEREVEDQPSDQRWTGDGLPWCGKTRCFDDRLDPFEHACLRRFYGEDLQIADYERARGIGSRGRSEECRRGKGMFLAKVIGHARFDVTEPSTLEASES